MPRNHQVQESDLYEEFEVEACLNRRVVLSENGRNKVQFLLKYVGYDIPEWTDSSNCTNCRSLIREFQRNGRAATVDQAGPADDYGEVEQDGEALLYCEALLASEASPLGIGDSAEEAEQPSDGPESTVEQPAVVLPAVVPPAIVLPAVVPLAIVPPAVVPPCKKKKKRCKRSAENRLRHIQCLKCSKRGHIKRDCPN